MRPGLPVLLLLLAACSADPAAPDAGPGGGVTTVVAATTTTVLPTTTVTSVMTTTTTVPGPEPWAVVVVGDFGTGGAAEGEVAAAMASWVAQHPETRALVTTGDNFYISDVVAAWEQPFGWVAETGLPVWAVPGNHDLETPGQWLASEEAFGSYPRWRTQEVAGITFVLLDSNQVESEEQRAWLAKTATALDGQPWIAVFHHPVKSCSLHGSTEAVRRQWADLLGSARLILNGHDHNYQRFETESGWQVVTGGGGQLLYDIKPCGDAAPDPVAGEVAWHFVVITGQGDTAEVTANDRFGGIIDSFVLDLAPRP